LGSIDPAYLDAVDRVLIRVNEADLDEGPVEVTLRAIDLHRDVVTLADFEDGIDPQGQLLAVNAGAGGIAAGGLDDGFNWWDVSANGDGDTLAFSGFVQGISVPIDVLVRDQNVGETRIATVTDLDAALDVSGFDVDALNAVDQIIFRVQERDLQPDATRALGATRLHLADVSLTG